MNSDNDELLVLPARRSMDVGRDSINLIHSTAVGSGRRSASIASRVHSWCMSLPELSSMRSKTTFCGGGGGSHLQSTYSPRLANALRSKRLCRSEPCFVKASLASQSSAQHHTCHSHANSISLPTATAIVVPSSRQPASGCGPELCAESLSSSCLFRKTRSRLCANTQPLLPGCLRRRALSRYFSTSFASSLDLNVISQHHQHNVAADHHHQSQDTAFTSSPVASASSHQPDQRSQSSQCSSSNENPFGLPYLCGFSSFLFNNPAGSSGYASRRSSLCTSPFTSTTDLVTHPESCSATSQPSSSQQSFDCQEDASCIACRCGRRLHHDSATKSSNVMNQSSYHPDLPLFLSNMAASKIAYETFEQKEAHLSHLFAQKFPKTKKVMEDRLAAMIEQMDAILSCNSQPIHPDVQLITSNGYVRFAFCQVLELAKNCLKRSKRIGIVDRNEAADDGGVVYAEAGSSELLSMEYLANLADKLHHIEYDALEKILIDFNVPSNVTEDSRHQVKVSSESLANILRERVHEFLLAISRTADILECLDSKPDEFYHTLTAVESQLKAVKSSLIEPTEIHRYIVSQLKINMPADHMSPSLQMIDTVQRTDRVTTSRPLLEVEQKKDGTGSHVDSSDETSNSNPCHLVPSFDDFNTIKRISSGSYGSVYLVQHKASGCYMALKRIKKQMMCRKNFIQQVFTERDILTFVRNPFVVSLLCSFETDRDLCLVMEYVEGGDVRSLLDYLQGPLSLDMTSLYFAETTLAVEYIHSHGIVHRDIKPSNLLITSCGHIKLTDFGLSRIGVIDLASGIAAAASDVNDQFSDYQIIGTPQYIAPEVILRRGYGLPIDMWSMGILLFEMLAGCTPFMADSVDGLFEMIVNADIEWPEYLEDTWAKHLIILLLNRCPSQRPTTIRQHRFFSDIDWGRLLLRKAEFIPSLSGPEDTSYFRDDNQSKTEDTFNAGESLLGCGESRTTTDEPYLCFSSCSRKFLVDYLNDTANSSDSGCSISGSMNNLTGSSFIGSPNALDSGPTDFDPLSAERVIAQSASSTTTLARNDDDVSNRRTENVDKSSPKQVAAKYRRLRGGLNRARSFFFFNKRCSDDQSAKLMPLLQPTTTTITTGKLIVYRLQRHPTVGYGFTLATFTDPNMRHHFSHRILSVIDQSPASIAGLVVDHEIVRINDRHVSTLVHTSVVRLIQKSKHKLLLCVSARPAIASHASPKPNIKRASLGTPVTLDAGDGTVGEDGNQEDNKYTEIQQNTEYNEQKADHRSGGATETLPTPPWRRRT